MQTVVLVSDVFLMEKELSDIANGILVTSRPSASEKLFMSSILYASMLVKNEDENVHEPTNPK